MAKKPDQPAIKLDEISAGGSYLVNPDAGTAQRVGGTEHPAPDLAPEPKAPVAPADPATQATAQE